MEGLSLLLIFNVCGKTKIGYEHRERSISDRVEELDIGMRLSKRCSFTKMNDKRKANNLMTINSRGGTFK